MSWVKYITGVVVILILQLLFSEFLNLWPMLYIVVIPLVIILLPADTSTYLLMAAGFGVGLLTDALADGILGLNAACGTLLGAVKPMVIRPMRKYNMQSEEFDINNGAFRQENLIILLVVSYLVFFVPYVLIDGSGASAFVYIVLRILINVAVNVVLAYLLLKLWIRRFF